MNSKSFIAGLLIAAVVFAGVGFYFFSQAPTGGSGGGTDHYFFEQFIAGLSGHVFIDLGGVQTLSAAATTTTITAAQICSGDTVTWSPAVTNSTTTIDSSANLAAACLNKNGNSVTLNLTNSSGTAIYNVVWPTNYTVYHASGTTATTITSSTPAEFEIFLTSLANSTSVSSTFAVYRTQFVTP